MSRYNTYFKHLDSSITNKFQDWLLKHEPKDTMYFKEPWWRNNVFIRDFILYLFPDSNEVVGSHYSKSIECPVVKTSYRGVEIIWQYNFYDWQIMVKSEGSLLLDNLSIFNADGDYFYYQGIPDAYHFSPYSLTENNKQFAISIYEESDPIDIGAFAIELRRAIDRNYE